MERKEYGNGQVAYQFFSDGTGTVYYPDGQIAISLTPCSDGILTHIFNSSSSGSGNPSLSHSQRLRHPLSRGSSSTHSGQPGAGAGLPLGSLDIHMRGVLLDPTSKPPHSSLKLLPGSEAILNEYLSASAHDDGKISLRYKAEGIVLTLPRPYISKAKMSTAGSPLPSPAANRELNGQLREIERSLRMCTETFSQSLQSPMALKSHKDDPLNATIDVTKNAPLRLSKTVRQASGRYKAPVILRSDSTKVALRTLSHVSYDSTIAEVSKEKPLMVCCWASWIPRACVYERVWEEANGVPGYQIMKYDMSESGFLRERHNVRMLPAFLIYHKGKLVFANHTFDTLSATVDITRDSKPYRKAMLEQLDAAANLAPLPEKFRFRSDIDGSLDSAMRNIEQRLTGSNFKSFQRR
eukprot:ANDGO_08576.mRNA.1 hypothetical protein